MWLGEEAVIKSTKLSSFLKYSTFFIALALIIAPAGLVWGASQDISVATGSDDAEEKISGGAMATSSSDLEMVMETEEQIIGIRFQGVNIPNGATVENAYIQFTADESTSEATTLTIEGQAADNPGTFTSSNYNISSRSTTTASVSWSSIPAWNTIGESGPNQQTTDLTAIVQEIVNRGGWSQGNSIVFIISGSGKRVANSADLAGGTPPRLHLEWTTFNHAVEFTQAESSGDEDGSTVDVEVQLTGGDPGATVTVDYDITNISTASGDYTPYLGSGTLTFTDDTPQDISVTLLADSFVEGDEQLLVTLSNLGDGGASVGLGAILQHVVTIIDDSPTVAFAQASSSGEETDGTVDIEVVLNKSWPDPVTVNYALNVGASTADSPDDFTLGGTGMLTFDGSTSQFIPVTLVDDEYQEPGETVVITLSNPSANASLGSNSEHTFVINSSDINTDWPMWRFDANRGGAGPVNLPETLYKQWELRLPFLEQAFPDQGTRINYDRCYEPIVLGRTLFVGSSVTDSMTAYDTMTGAMEWRFFADSPIRFAPVGWLDDPADGNDDKIFFVSDDGHLYCVNANDGTLIWKFRGAPATNRGLGNSRLGSLWPARGGPTLLDGKIYFSAGIWPFMGSFIYALDAATGDVVWVNDGSGSRWMDQPHGGSTSFSGLAPQGYMTAVGDRLIVPNGRAVAGALDLATGEFLYFRFADINSSSNNYVGAYGTLFNNSNSLFNISNGSSAGSLTNGAIMTAGGYYTAFCMAGDRLYKGSTNSVSATTTAGSTIWTKTISGSPASMIAGDSKLFVVTQEGSIYCFGAVDVSSPPVINEVAASIAWPATDAWTTMAEDILTASQANEGYCMVLGVGTGRLMEELARQVEINQYDMYIIGLDPDAAKVKALRERWHGMGILNQRLSAFAGEICTEKLPPYLAHLIVSEDLDAAGKANGTQFVEKVFHSLRPYGGTVCFPDTEQTMLEQGVLRGRLANAEVSISGDYALLERVGALPDSDDWTHLYANASQTVVSRDKLVKAPLGLLWFGGSKNTNVFPRHIHSPSEQVVGGRLFIEGANHMTARDVYTGRVIWERYLENLGNYYYGASSSNPSHYSGSNVVGTNYVCTEDSVYIAMRQNCLRLDPATGATISTFTLTEGDSAGAAFVQLRIWENLLIVGADPIIYSGAVGNFNYNETSCRELVVMDRYTGAVLWQRRANHSFHHNTIIIGKSGSQDILFCIDRVPPGQSDAYSLKGVPAQNPSAPLELLAMDVWNEAEVAGGDVIWSTTTDVFGTWLGYSEEYDVLLQAGRSARDTSGPEPTRQIAYTGSGTKLWEQGSSSGGPHLLHGDMVISQGDGFGNARNILDGTTYNRVHPMTGAATPWSFSRFYGCNTAIGSEYLLTFRSGAAGYYDMKNNSGTGNFGGFKSSCTSNLIVANGVLSAPDYVRTCTCGYQNRTSLAMVHMPEAEMWTYNSGLSLNGPIKKVGINFGAPGDRLADNGTFWVDYPSVGGTSPVVSVSISPTPSYFRHHGGRFEGEQTGWVTASGAIGATSVTVTLNNSSPRQYLVRLYFAEPEGKAVGERVFNVSLEGTQVLTDLDIADEVGSDGEGLIAEFRGVMIDSALNVSLTASAGVPVLCGIEVLEEISPNIDGSPGVDTGDLARLWEDWLMTGPFMDTDLYPDQIIDIWDFSTLSQFWQE